MARSPKTTASKSGRGVKAPGAACSEKDAGLKKGKAAGRKEDGIQDRRVSQKDPGKDHSAQIPSHSV